MLFVVIAALLIAVAFEILLSCRLQRAEPGILANAPPIRAEQVTRFREYAAQAPTNMVLELQELDRRTYELLGFARVATI